MTIREDVARELCRQALRADRGAYDKIEFDVGVLWPQFVPNANAVLALLPAQEQQDISTAVEAERKACAKLAGDTALAWDNTLGGRMIGEEVSKAILARGTLFAEERGTK